MICRCSRCGEPLTAPVFIMGMPYGWACALIMQPGMRKPKKEKYVKSDSHDFINGERVKVTAIYNGRKYIVWFFKVSRNNQTFYHSPDGEFDGVDVFIKCSSYKSLN